jgi:hypothetical protein
MTSPQHLNSLSVRLRHATGLAFDDTLTELLSYPDVLDLDVLDPVVEIVESKMKVGTYVRDEPLANLILRAGSSRLYEKVSERLLQNDWTALILYKGRYPDPKIEEKLCTTLYQVAANDGEPRRRCIVEAMREVGSEAALPTLDAILFDLEPSAKIRQVFANGLGVVGKLKAISRGEFVKLIALAIDDIKGRIGAAPETATPTAPKQTQADETANARRNRTQALRYIESEPEAAIVFIRRGAEALAKDLYRRLGHERNGKPARKMTLEELLKPVKDSNVPEVFKLLIQTLQLFGNFAAHDQDDQSIYVTKKIASSLLALYDQALLIYSQWIGASGPPANSGSA